MLSQEVAKKYASALFLSVKEKNKTEDAYEQFDSLKELLKKDRSLLNFLAAPQVLDSHKHQLVRNVFTGRLDQLFVEFLLVLVEKNRINFLPEIIDEFDRLVEAEKGIGRVTVITAVPMQDTERARLIEKMTARTNLKIVLEEKIDTSILGGVIVILHNEIIDGSVKHGLQLLEEQLQKTRVH